MEEDEDNPVAMIRSAAEIARRTLTLSAVVSVACGDSRDAVERWLQSESLWGELSPRELAFISMPELTRKAVIEFTWQVERLVPLLWAIGKIPDFPSLACQCDTAPIKRALVWPPASTTGFIASAIRRNDQEIDEEYERIYRAHWRVRDAKLRKLPPPGDLDAGVVFERHWSFNWLIGYFGQSWDDIKTDT